MQEAQEQLRIGDTRGGMKAFRRRFGLGGAGLSGGGVQRLVAPLGPYQRAISDKQLAENIHDE